MADTEKGSRPVDSGKQSSGGKQTDLAEGELETVEESLREHEKKGDLPEESPGKEKEDAA
ncbi:MAG TPA: hypothetical protein VJ732_09305 [Bryobacteraceae bacterium]|nr:hypothetical protein [Bryobacteraceae bacterium]